jgi:hypothetical protein
VPANEAETNGAHRKHTQQHNGAERDFGISSKSTKAGKRATRIQDPLRQHQQQQRDKRMQWQHKRQQVKPKLLAQVASTPSNTTAIIRTRPRKQQASRRASKHPPPIQNPLRQNL